ncbi:TetR/AcrR family transcriptional regulator [Streptomyces sp. NBC_01285]|uniref:TetR/AcrR family transcriptional regulator n=1 Tax=Streptomyces sp. NBC_01285 TaxID=2903813 RepID=UPI0022524ADF|nr:TetR/AcrR family transcriptional regulator [Streptomyces sp. NBC_01285]MCX4768569.1 TetR/AcrR family transcriptional regulator [Streptomyces sp. NBC_01285]
MFSEHVQSRAAKREATRRKVLSSAERLFREQGFGSSTIRQIATDAEVSTGTVMSVGDKDALLVAIFDTWIAAVHHGREHRDEQGDETPLPPAAVAQEVLDLVEPFITYFALDLELSREYAAVIVRGTHESEVFRALARALLTELETLLARTPITATGAGAGARTLYFAYLGILMTVGNGALDQRAAIAQFQEVIHFVVHREGAQR